MASGRLSVTMAGRWKGSTPPLRRPQSVWLLALNENLVDLVGIELLGDAGEDDR